MYITSKNEKDKLENVYGKAVAIDGAFSMPQIPPTGKLFVLQGDYDGRFYGTQSSNPNTPSLLEYDTIVGVGDSIMQAEFSLTKGQFDTPYRGINFKSAAQYGTTLENIINSVSTFIDLAENRTLFIVRVGINDCNTLLSAGGVEDTDTGPVIDWDSMAEQFKTESLNKYRQLVSLLEPHGDVALATITYCDAKGTLLPMPDKGRNLHSGSWNDNSVVPLCQELTPDWFDPATGRPVLDYYTYTYENPELLDDDNLHFYDDWSYSTSEFGYTNGAGSYHIRQYMLQQVASITNLPPEPYDDTKYRDRLLVSVGRGSALLGRPANQPWANNLDFDVADTVYNNLRTLKQDSTSISMGMTWDTKGSAKGNLNTRDQPWSDGCLDYNIASTSIAGRTEHNHVYTISNFNEKGLLCLVGVFGAVETHDATQRTVFKITDDNGTRDVEVPSSFDQTTTNLIDLMGSIEIDCTTSGNLVIKVEAAAGSTYGTLSGFSVDIAK
jgi:hypothetical protein